MISKPVLIGVLVAIFLIGIIILGGLAGNQRILRREAAAFSAFVKTTGNKHNLTFEEWRASR